jgi:hypothetical protein
MTKLKGYIEEAAAKLGTKGAVCDRLGITRQGLNQAEHRGSMEMDHCIELARILDCDPSPILKAAYEARNPGKAEFWSRWVAAIAIMAIGVGTIYPFDSMAYADFQSTALYIMRTCGQFTLLLVAVAWIASKTELHRS